MSEEREKAVPEETEEGGEDVEGHANTIGQTTPPGATEDDDDVEGHMNTFGQTTPPGQVTGG